ncbi:MAG: 4Fe-4S binding protein [Prochlorococcaceae cyanobacterium]|nr:4Fe-4S binding protein [Synechococcus sp.]
MQEQDRYERLAPYRVLKTRRGVLGSSRYACKLRQELREAANDPARRPVLVMGEPGLEKDNLAALIHFGSADRRQPLVRIDGALLHADGSDLWGRATSDEPSLLECIGDGTLLLDKLDKAPKALQPRLIALACEHPGRVIVTSECAIPALSNQGRLIRVPPLRLRRQDLGEWLRFGVRLESRKQGWSRPPSLAPGIIKQLQRYDFPNNLRELEQVIYRALQQARRLGEGGLPLELPDDVFWTDSVSRPRRFELWRWRPELRLQMRSPRLWNVLLFGLVSWLFVAVNLWLWWGPQERASNGALNLFWAWWWPLILLGYPLVGRLWCSFCPFMVWGEIAQGIAKRLGWQPRSWPRGEHDDWASPLLAIGFGLILLWEELAHLENTAWLSSCLLLLITAGAVLGSLIFEKRFWCRYLCPIGGMNGLFAKLSILELRADAGTCSGSCSSYACFKGGPADGEGLATAGCPLGTHPAHLSDNRNCVLCLTCVQACPHRSVQLSLRPPAADLRLPLNVPRGEPLLILILFGGLVLHWGRPALEGLPMAQQLLLASLELALPALMALGLRRWLGVELCRQALYGLLPLLLALLLARHLPVGMGEAGQFLPVSLGAGWPSWSADHHVVAFCQSAAVLVGSLSSWWLLRRMLSNESHNLWLATGLTASVGCLGRWLVA